MITSSAVPQSRSTGFAANVRALNYKNEHIIARLAAEAALSHEDAEVLFDDTLKFLALAGNGTKLSPPAKIDLGWHNFILHTRDYNDFCQSCFGRFIHHEPGDGLTGTGPRLDVVETVALVQSFFGELSANWDNTRGTTCGSGGC